MGECFFWYRPTWVVPDKGPLNGCVCACAKVVVTDMFIEAAIAPEAVLKAVTFANLSALMLPSKPA